MGGDWIPWTGTGGSWYVYGQIFAITDEAAADGYDSNQDTATWGTTYILDTKVSWSSGGDTKTVAWSSFDRFHREYSGTWAVVADGEEIPADMTMDGLANWWGFEDYDAYLAQYRIWYNYDGYNIWKDTWEGKAYVGTDTITADGKWYTYDIDLTPPRRLMQQAKAL
ncbi:MAG: hypothetical protein LBM77_12775 [Spirochaetaceae bacterium]|jgi:hypothetical protein|nr:hypothetical protein [Spirochaetaceae bacterium]